MMAYRLTGQQRGINNRGGREGSWNYCEVRLLLVFEVYKGSCFALLFLLHSSSENQGLQYLTQ